MSGSVNTKIIDGGGGSGADAQTTPEGELCVIGAPYPPFQVQKVQPFRQHFTNDGLAIDGAGNEDMGIDGDPATGTTTDFYIPANTKDDRYITSINILLGYGSIGKPYLFADVAALTTGCRLFYSSLRGEVDIHESLQNNQDFFRLSLSEQITTSWEIRHLNANNDYGYVINMDLTKLGLPFGVKLDAGSNQRVTMRIQDDCTDADSFNIIGYGFERFK